MTLHLPRQFRRPSLCAQKGAAIIVALFITSLVAIAAVAMIERLRIDVRRTALSFNSIQGNFYAQGSVAWAMDELNVNLKNKKPEKLVDPIPIKSPIHQLENATVSSVIFDQEGLFNLNNLSLPLYQENFARLIKTVAPQTDQNLIESIILAIMDWVTVGTHSYDDYYLSKTPPYRAGHRFMMSVSELRLVKGMTPALFEALLPYICALPEVTKINVNTAPVPVLMTLSPGLTSEAAYQILGRRVTPFLTVESFTQFDIVKNFSIPSDKITILSSYFLVKTSVKVEQQETVLYTLLHRILKNAQPIEVVLWQSKGTL